MRCSDSLARTRNGSSSDTTGAATSWLAAAPESLARGCAMDRHSGSAKLARRAWPSFIAAALVGEARSHPTDCLSCAATRPTAGSHVPRSRKFLLKSLAPLLFQWLGGHVSCQCSQILFEHAFD